MCTAVSAKKALRDLQDIVVEGARRKRVREGRCRGWSTSQNKVALARAFSKYKVSEGLICWPGFCSNGLTPLAVSLLVPFKTDLAPLNAKYDSRPAHWAIITC